MKKWLFDLLARLFPRKPESKQPRKSRKRVNAGTDTGAFQSLGELLKQLDSYHDRFASVKKGALLPEYWKAAKKLGLHVVHHNFDTAAANVSSYEYMPTFLRTMVIDDAASPSDEERNRHLAAIILGEKTHAPPYGVEQIPEDVFYHMIVGFVAQKKNQKYKFQGWSEYFVAINPDRRKWKVCRQALTKTERIHTHRGVTSYSHSVFDIPHFINDRTRPDATDKDILQDVFVHAFNQTVAEEFHWNVHARKNDRKLTFSIEDNDAKYFFRERLGTVTKGGRKAPIFHSVTSHMRNLKDGRQTTVRTHWKGLTSFRWAGYDIKIEVPGRKAPSIANFDLPGIGEEHWDSGRDGEGILLPELAEHLEESIEADSLIPFRLWRNERLPKQSPKKASAA